MSKISIESERHYFSDAAIKRMKEELPSEFELLIDSDSVELSVPLATSAQDACVAAALFFDLSYDWSAPWSVDTDNNNVYITGWSVTE